MPKGWYDGAKRLPTPNFGYPKGTKNQNRPLFFVDHIMAGYKRTLDAGMAGVGVTFGIGLDGSISQYTSIFDAHWGNGLSGNRALYDRSNPHLSGLERLPGANWGKQWNAVWKVYFHYLARGGVNLPNSHSISIEHEGFTGDQWPEPMVDATVRVKRWCLDELARAGMPMHFDTDALVGHYQIDGVHRVNCPGDGWARATILQAIEGESMKRKNGFAQAFENKSFNLAKKGIKLNVVKEFKVPAGASQVRIEIFMDAGGIVVRDGSKAYAGQVSQRWDKQHGVIDAYPKDNVIYLDVEKASKVRRIGCLGYVA